MYLYFTGEKTYDDGNNYSAHCMFGWKLYDSEGYAIDSGTFYSDAALKVGEKFKNNTVIIFDIEPGETYTLEILDIG